MHYAYTTFKYNKIWIGVNFYGDFHFDVENESENWNFLKYGRIKKYP